MQTKLLGNWENFGFIRCKKEEKQRHHKVCEITWHVNMQTLRELFCMPHYLEWNTKKKNSMPLRIFMNKIVDFFFLWRDYSLLPLWQITATSEASGTDCMTAVCVRTATFKNNITASRIEAKVWTQSNVLW